MGDWVALYGAFLSTVLAGVGVWNWLRREVYLTVTGIHPSESWLGQNQGFSFVITNSGRSPVVVREVQVTFLESKHSNAKIVGETKFNSSSMWNPAQKSEPVEGKPNTTRRVPNVLQRGDEIHGMASPIEAYLPNRHWIKISAFARNSKREFIGWIEPKTEHA